MREPSQIDWARLAAFIDGEGCISISGPSESGKRTRSTYLLAKITNTDARLLEWVGNTLRMATEVLEGCLPYFIIKKEQAEVGLAHQRLIGIRQREKSPRITPESFNARMELRDQLSMLKGTHSRRQDLRSEPAVQ
jgi:hypothetical protein